MMPTPTPAPPMPMHAMPAPISFAAAASIFSSLERKKDVGGNSPDRLVSRMKGVVEVDAGEDREHVGLQECDQQFKRGQRDGERQRQHAADPADRAERDAKHRNEAREHLQRNMAGQHVGEQAYAVRDRAEQERQDFNEHDQRQDVDRNAGRHENLEESQPVLVETVDQDGEEHQKCERRGDDDVARNRERVGDDAHEVRNADEHEQREDQREELHAFRAGRAADRAGDELVADFGHRLETPGNELPPGDATDHQDRDQRHRQEHVEGRIGDGDRLIADMADREERLDVELMDRVDFHPRGSWSSGFAAGNRISNDRTSRQRSALPGATPADLTTLTTPATKPSRKNTMRPNGDVDSKRSKPQPITAPTTTPAINSEESRKPRAIAEALAAPSPLPAPDWSVPTLRLSRISDNR